MTHSKNLRRILLLSTFLVLSSAVAVGVYTRTSKSQKKAKGYGQTYQAASVTTAPQVVSNIDGLEISGINLINGGTAEAALNIDVTNKRNEAVMALDFIAGSTDYSGMAMDGLLDEDAPRVIIPPHSLKTFTWYLGAILEGETVVLAAAIFADGKEEGDKRFLNGIKKSRLKYQAARREEKIKNGGQK